MRDGVCRRVVVTCIKQFILVVFGYFWCSEKLAGSVGCRRVRNMCGLCGNIAADLVWNQGMCCSVGLQ